MGEAPEDAADGMAEPMMEATPIPMDEPMAEATPMMEATPSMEAPTPFAAATATASPGSRMRMLWPPPKASASIRIPDEMIVRPGASRPTLGEVSALLERAFASAGYRESSYFAVPGGFCLATRMEQINEDGSPKPAAIRFVIDRNLPPTDIGSYVRALFTAPAGLYRAVLVVATPEPIVPSETAPTRREITSLVGRGALSLSQDIGEQRFTARHRCVGLIYEFRKASGEARLSDPSALDGLTHLTKAGVWPRLSP